MIMAVISNTKTITDVLRYYAFAHSLIHYNLKNGVRDEFCKSNGAMKRSYFIWEFNDHYQLY